MQLPERLAILKTIMLRRDISAAAKQLAWFLLLERMNAETSLCYSTDKNLAADLNVNDSTIERAKSQLRKARIIEATPQNCGLARASFYRFKKTGSLPPAELRASRPQNCGLPSQLRVTQPRSSAGEQPLRIAGQQKQNDPRTEMSVGLLNAQAGINAVLAKFGSPQEAAWLEHSRRTGQRFTESKKHGGLWVPSEWPPVQQPGDAPGASRSAPNPTGYSPMWRTSY